MSAKSKRATSRDLKITRISQAHVAPGMSLAQWNEIVLQKHGIPARARADAWEKIPETTLDAIIADLSAVISPRPLGGQGGAA
ncbi:MAG: hypothetical protein BroJett011_04400 [Chloroflexota bacterium]|nr:MAG: hypothetical protein BroJett011_04400 [Chloroflexota bacterium]